MVGSSVGNNKCRGEFLQRMYDLHNEIKENNRCQHGKRNVPELDPFGRPSTSAASYSSVGTFLSPARKRTMGGAKLPDDQKTDGYQSNIRISQPVHRRNM